MNYVTEYKKVQIEKRVNVRFFHEKWETLKAPKTSISYLHVIRFQMETKNSATIIDFKIVTMLLEEKLYMINNFDTDKQRFQ